MSDLRENAPASKPGAGAFSYRALRRAVTFRQARLLRERGLRCRVTGVGLIDIEVDDPVRGLRCALRLTKPQRSRGGKGEPLTGWVPRVLVQRDCDILDRPAAREHGIWLIWRTLHRLKLVPVRPPAAPHLIDLSGLKRGLPKDRLRLNSKR